MFNILVTEDDTNTRKLLCAILKKNGFHPFPAEDGTAAFDVLQRQQIDLVILDIMMPGIDGFEVCRQLRAQDENLPVLMLTARQESADKRQGFLPGTDDYLTKPFDEEELLLRIQALLRRAQIAHDRQLTAGDTTLDYDSLSVTRNGQRVTLPQKEFYLLFKLLSYPGVIFTRLQLMDEIWGVDSETDGHTLNVHINRLRERFRDNPDFEIITVRGLGYKAERLT
jgi:two-component system OmpR family response regulator